MGWRIDVQGAVLNEDDVKAAHVSVVNAALETKGWDAIDPISSPEALIVWCAVAVSEATKTDLGESLVFIQSLPIRDVIGFFTAEAPAEVPEAPVERPAPVPSTVTTPDPDIEAQRRRVLEQLIAASRDA